MKILSTCLLAFLLCSQFVFAQVQSAKSLKEQYEEGKRHYRQGSYEQAIESFRPLSRVSENNPYTEYASFYFGLSALRDGQYNLAKNMFLQIQSKFARWEKTDETHFWLAKTYFELEDYPRALEKVEQIQGGSFSAKLKADARAMKAYELSQIRDVRLLESLLSKFPQEKQIARQLVKVLSYTVYDKAAELRVAELVEKYDIDMKTLGGLSQESSVKKDAYHVALMLPFLYDKLSTSSDRQGNQFVIDLYKGIRMAADDLQAQGIKVSVHAYDTERSREVTENLLAEEEMNMMDLFVGPLFPGPYRAVGEYALENEKYLFNPLSSNPAAVGDNPFAYLMKPSLITRGHRAAQFAIDSLNRSQAVVITDTSGQDSLLVSSFVERFEEAGDREAVVLEEDNFNRDRIEELVELLNEMGEDNLVYVASDNELIITNTISTIVMAEHDIPVIGSEEWLDISSITYDQLEDFEEYLIAPGYVDPEREQFVDFTDKYRRSFYELPNKYVYTGYDLMMYIGFMLDRYGVYFQEFHNEEENVPGLLYAGYNYFQANDNQLIPIIKYEEGGLQAVDIRAAGTN
jgi:tetratricopeptide (TPR) repeat protein